jgi:hypothetical protein
MNQLIEKKLNILYLIYSKKDLDYIDFYEQIVLLNIFS